MVAWAGFDLHRPVVELATGTGRMTAVLAHLGYRVISGDRTQERRERVMERLASHQPRVTLVGLEMGQLPFRSASLMSVTCVNTLHEVDGPGPVLQELLRVRHARGRLLIADFNERGFDVMERLEREVYRRDHPRRSMPMADVERVLHEAGARFRRFETGLNVVVAVG